MRLDEEKVKDSNGFEFSGRTGSENRVITYFEFRQRLLMATGWEQFTGLFRFFVHFHQKMDTEVAQTIQALELLCRALEGVCGGMASTQ